MSGTRRVTRDQRTAILLFIATYTTQHGYTPTTREIAASRGLALSTTTYVLRQLQRQDRLIHVAGRRRGWVVAQTLPAFGSHDFSGYTAERVA